MTERKTITLNQQYQLRVDYDLRDGDINIYSQHRSDKSIIDHHGNDVGNALFNFGDCGDDKELLEKIVEVSQEIIDWIDSMDIDALISEHAECEAEERRAETKEDMERNGE